MTPPPDDEKGHGRGQAARQGEPPALAHAARDTTPRRLTLSTYIRRRNGLPAGARGSLRNMLHRAFGASSFAGFWRHWNPVFGYGLGRFVHRPLLRRVPAPVALLATFVACGALHDLVTMAARGAPAFLFTPWFLCLGTGVLLGEAAGMDLSGRPWAIRAAVHAAYLSACLAITLWGRHVLGWTGP
ncbi:acyltransferase [Marilutibacter aestuarii]|uniref:Acyltransferase n=1 Tax=Marilutibacter aestuarii TaxID=1706195 RepID=A0A508APT7_9GAMM|nr:acyltransferase [Lysobacter aestuarii]TQD49748.1 acyltransferase [Lysobacter aestuarii]